MVCMDSYRKRFSYAANRRQADVVVYPHVDTYCKHRDTCYRTDENRRGKKQTGVVGHSYARSVCQLNRARLSCVRRLIWVYLPRFQRGRSSLMFPLLLVFCHFSFDEDLIRELQRESRFAEFHFSPLPNFFPIHRSSRISQY